MTYMVKKNSEDSFNPSHLWTQNHCAIKNLNHIRHISSLKIFDADILCLLARKTHI